MDCGKVIGVGNTAKVYEWKDNKVLKLFNKGYPIKAIEREFQNVTALEHMDFNKPKAYEMISHENQIGIVYSKVSGISLLDWVLETKNIKQCAIYMAELHQSMLRNKIQDVGDYKEFLESNIVLASTDNSEEMLKNLQRLDDDDILCHGDFHPGNIIMSGGQSVVIDFMNVCRGSYLYDVARTVFLVEYTPVPEDIGNRDEILFLKKALSEMYLEEMNVTKAMIEDYLTVIAEARKGECPDE